MGRQKGVSKKVKVTTAAPLAGRHTSGETASRVYGWQAIQNDKEQRREQLSGSLVGRYILLCRASALIVNV